MKRAFLLFAAILAGCAGAPARPRADRGLEFTSVARDNTDHNPNTPEEIAFSSRPTLSLARALAVARNPDLRVARERVAAQRARAPAVNRLPGPSFRYEYSSMFKTHSYGLEQSFPYPTKARDERLAAEAEVRALEGDRRARELELRAEAARAYADLALARREVALLEESVALLSRSLDAARGRVAAGSATQAEVLLIEVERDSLRAESAVRRREIEAAAGTLNALLDRPGDAPLGPLEPLPRPPSPAPSPTGPTATAALVARALAARADLAAAEERVTGAEAALARARGEWLPDLMVGAAYVRDFGQDENEVELMAGLSLPIFPGGAAGAVAAAEAESRRTRAEARAARARAEGEVRAAVARAAGAAERRRVLEEDVLPRAREAVRVAEAGYAAGTVDFAVLVEAARGLLSREIESERAAAEWVVRAADLERAAGGQAAQGW